MSVCREYCVLSGRGFCDELITRPEESYRLWCVVVCDLETSCMKRPWPTEGCRAKNKQNTCILNDIMSKLPSRAIIPKSRSVEGLSLENVHGVEILHSSL